MAGCNHAKFKNTWGWLSGGHHHIKREKSLNKKSKCSYSSHLTVVHQSQCTEKKGKKEEEEEEKKTNRQINLTAA